MKDIQNYPAMYKLYERYPALAIHIEMIGKIASTIPSADRKIASKSQQCRHSWELNAEYFWFGEDPLPIHMPTRLLEK